MRVAQAIGAAVCRSAPSALYHASAAAADDPDQRAVTAASQGWSVHMVEIPNVELALSTSANGVVIVSTGERTLARRRTG